MVDSMHHELDQLRRENARLIGLLEAHGIAWRSSEPPRPEPPPGLSSARCQCSRFGWAEGGTVPSFVSRS